MPAFLLEIGLEEIPASMVPAAQTELATRFRGLVTREHLAGDSFDVKSFSTPRRLAVLAEGLLPKQADREEQVTGPSVAVAYKNGVPTPAATAFAKKSGVEVSALMIVQTAKGEYVSATVRRAGRSAAEVLTSLLPAEIAGIYWPKNMYWRVGKPERFVRPLRWLLALLDEEVLPLEFAGVTGDGASYGHRVLRGPAPVVIRRAQEYRENLAAGYVEVDPEARRHRIRKALDAAARQIPDARWREDEALVEAVTNLTEWPSVILGSFDPLGLPEEVLVTVMRDHQKYFALEDANGKLLPNFLAVLNIEVDADGAAIIRHGNERVLRARFNDARFFWDVDQKIPLEQRVEMLKNVTFQKDIGSYWDKARAIANISGRISDVMIANSHGLGSNSPIVDRTALLQAAELAKCDLTTEMVKEFTELQGVVGGLYARAEHLPSEVADAIYSQYLPASIFDPIPRTDEGRVLAMADRIHTLVAMFHIGLQPSGSKDPLALRRAGNGIAKILAVSAISEFLSVSELIDAATGAFGSEQSLCEQVHSFLGERVAYYLEDVENIPRNCVMAAMAGGFENVRDCRLRAQLFAAMLGSPDFLAVCASFKRIRNILDQAKANKELATPQVAAELFVADAEKQLYIAATPLSARISRGHNYQAILQDIAALRTPIDAFFESVLVMDPNMDVRRNRLALLQQIQGDYSRIGDFSLIMR